MNNSQGKDKIYDALKGYFPPEYDLTPDELEKEIETENKKREIALGMMRTKLKSPEGEDAIGAKKDSAKDFHSQKESGPSLASLTEKFSSSDPLDESDDLSVYGNGDNKAAAEGADEHPPLIITDPDHIEDSKDTVIKEEEEIIPLPQVLDDGTNDVFGDENLDDLFTEMENTKEAKDNSEKEASRRSNVSWLFDLLEVFAICITCIIVIFAVFFRLTRVSGESMEDTLFDKEYLIVSDLLYTPEVGDIVVIQNTSLDSPLLREPLVKRVIAVGGQSVSISRNGVVTLVREDGTKEILDQSFTKDEPYAGLSGRYDVPEGYVFVMGDNRNNSTDSRSPMVGLVDERCIFGKAIVRILPINTFTVFENPYND